MRGHIKKQEFAEKMMENRKRLYCIAYSYVKNEQDALDIISEAACKGLLHLRELERAEYFMTWMTKIVINTSIDFIRKNSRYTALPEDSDGCAEMIYPGNGQDAEPDREALMDLYNALDILEPEERTYIVLRYFEEYNFREIAQMLKLPESTVKSRFYRALEKMKQHMTGGCVG